MPKEKYDMNFVANYILFPTIKKKIQNPLKFDKVKES